MSWVSLNLFLLKYILRQNLTAHTNLPIINIFKFVQIFDFVCLFFSTLTSMDYIYTQTFRNTSITFVLLIALKVNVQSKCNIIYFLFIILTSKAVHPFKKLKVRLQYRSIGFYWTPSQNRFLILKPLFLRLTNYIHYCFVLHFHRVSH